MWRDRLLLTLLLVTCFALATYLQPRQMVREAAQGQSASVLALMLGDARKIFAERVFARADAYFHRGKYPSIFEDTRDGEDHMTEATHDNHDDHDHEAHAHDAHDEDAAGADAREEHAEDTARPRTPNDWIEAFGQRFIPNEHMHLEGGGEREMLPWLQLSAELDPQRAETYVVTAYWLRDRLGKADEAEQFLRQGLRANPHSTEILYELGRLYFESHKDVPRARNLWATALRRWHQVEDPRPADEKDLFLLEQILGGLFRLELQAGNPARAIEYLRQLKVVSPSPEGIQKRIDELAPLLQPAGR